MRCTILEVQEIFAPPLEGEQEAYCIRMLDGVHAERAKGADRTLAAGCIHSKKFDNTGSEWRILSP